MDEKIAPGLFARLMQLSAPTRKDLLEYLGQGPVSAESLLNGAHFGRVSASSGPDEPKPLPGLGEQPAE